MKNYFSILLLVFGFSIAKSQTQNPIEWSAVYSVSSNEIVISGTIQNGWHTYSQRPTEAGPIPTSIAFTPNANYELVGKPIETDAHEEFVKAFDAKIFVFTNKAEFKQKIKVKNKNHFSISLKVEYMSCNDMMCLPPKTIELQVKIQ